MIKTIIILIPIIIIIHWIRYKKYINPYKLIMVFGKKGSGKSSYLVKLALYYNKKKYIVYSNMEDLNLPFIRHFDINDLGDFVPEANSVILCDEAGIVFDNRNYKKFKESQRDFFKYQRHYKVIIYLASQTYDIDKKLRDLVDSMILVQNIGIVYSLLRPIRKTITLTEATSEGESRIAENLKFKSILSWKLFKITKYSKYFESFAVPARPPLPFNVKEKEENNEIVKDNGSTEFEKFDGNTQNKKKRLRLKFFER